MVQPAQRMPSAAAVCASPLVRDGLAYPNSESPLFKDVGDLLPVAVSDDEAGVGFLQGGLDDFNSRIRQMLPVGRG